MHPSMPEVVRSPPPNPTLPTFHASAEGDEGDEEEEEDEEEEQEEEDDARAENEETQQQPSRFGARISLLPLLGSGTLGQDSKQQSIASDAKNNDDEFPFVDVSYEMEEILNSQVVEIDPKGNALFPLFPVKKTHQ